MFTLPFNPADTSVILFEKRLFVLMCGFSLCAGLTALMSATAALVMLRLNAPPSNHHSLQHYLDNCTGGLWNITFVNFLFATLGYLSVVIIRAWNFIHCPTFARAVVLIMSSSVLLIVKIIDRSLEFARDGSNGQIKSFKKSYGIKILGGEIKKYFKLLTTFVTREADGRLFIDYMKIVLSVMNLAGFFILGQAVQILFYGH